MADILAEGKPFSEAIRLEDGFWYHWTEQGAHSGATAAWLMRAIADRLDELNKPWADHIDAHLPRSNGSLDDLGPGV